MFQGGHSRLRPVSGTDFCDIVLPVFNRPDAVRDVLISLSKNTNRALLGRIWIGDDGSDVQTQQVIATTVKELKLPAAVIRQPKNVGFGQNCNELFARSNARYVIVLNTDVILPPFWLERMLEAFASDERVALATPYATNAANHTMRLQHGQSWLEADRLLSSRQPQFPDDCTAIGFCMAVDRMKLLEKNIPLFDPAFGRGYGEDTDLHYRVLQAGFRSVIVDHLLVHHEGASSFSTLPDAAAIREKGAQLFWERWGDRHAEEHARFEHAGALSQVMDAMTHVCSFSAPSHRVDVLFVLPSAFLRYGGVWFLCKITEHLLRQGYAAAVYVQDEENVYSDLASFGFRAFQTRDALHDAVKDVGCVIASSDATIDTAASIAKRYQCPHALFLQCMEICFRSGISINTFRHYERAEHVITVSQGLSEYIKLFQPTADVHTLPIGPDPLVFYPRDVQRVPKTVAIAVSLIPEKAYTHALEVALLLKQRGFHLTFFGWDTEHVHIPSDIGTVMKDTSRTAVAELFSRTEFLLDHSYLEGLGLLPLEAAMCGCVPIIASKGAPEYIFQDGYDSIRLTGYKTLEQTLERITSLTQTDLAALRKNAARLRTMFTLQKGCVAFERVLHAWGIQKPQPWKNRDAYMLKPR